MISDGMFSQEQMIERTNTTMMQPLFNHKWYFIVHSAVLIFIFLITKIIELKSNVLRTKPSSTSLINSRHWEATWIVVWYLIQSKSLHLFKYVIPLWLKKNWG